MPYYPFLFDQPQRALVDQTIAPNLPGRVRFEASFWPAQFYDDTCPLTIASGNWVWVVGRMGIKLLVKPVAPESPDHESD